MNAEILRQTINEAGTILYSSEGHAFFELNGKTPEFAERLKNVVSYLASYANSSWKEGVPHPLTQSTGTVMLKINVDPANPRITAAQTLRDALFFSGNCYAYSISSLSQTLGRAATATPEQLGMDLMQHAYKAVPAQVNGVNGKWKAGEPLSEFIAISTALHIHELNGLITEKAHVPLNLFSRDPVKAKAVEIFLRDAARQTQGEYRIQTAKIDGVDTASHYVRSERLVSYLVAKAKDPLLLLGGADAYEQDIAKNSGPLPRRNTPSVLESKGSILDDLNIVSNDFTSIEGIPLMGQSPR